MSRTCTAVVPLRSRERVAVVGGGVSGLVSAWLLGPHADVVLFEADGRVGGHVNTVDIETEDGDGLAVDTGFIVYNERNYPLLSRLFRWLHVPTRPSDMSFGVSIDEGRIEYAGDNLRALFAQPANLLRPSHWRMLADIVRFNRDTLAWLHGGALDRLTLGEYVARNRYSRAFRDRYLLPMAGAIWSCPTETMLDFPAASFAAFFRNHGLLHLGDRPRWRTVVGGARQYVERLLHDFAGRVHAGTRIVKVRRVADGVELFDSTGLGRRFDRVVLACHADQALGLLDQPRDAERELLGAFKYQHNEAVLHSDADLMPRRTATWSSWNYLSGREDRIAVTYWMNRLQSLPGMRNWFVTLNPVREPRPETVVRRIDYRHPVFDARATAAQARLHELHDERVSFVGAWQGYGFHEDGVRSAVRVAERMGVLPPWDAETGARDPAPQAAPSSTRATLAAEEIA